MRASSLARYFPGEDIRVDVLTARNAAAVGIDLALLSDIPSDVTVHRTLTLDLPFGAKKALKRLVSGARKGGGQQAAAETGGERRNLFSRVLAHFLVPDPQVTWLPVLTRAARRTIKQRQIDLVLITVPPFSSILLVEQLRKEFPDLPIVIDFRDEWLTTTFDLVSFLFSKGERARRIAEQTENSGIKNATAIVTVTEAARQKIRSRYPQQPAEKFHLIPNGFDATKLVPSSAPKPATRGRKVIVTHLGTLYASTDPTVLVDALKSLPPEISSALQLRFIGHIEEPRFRNALLEFGGMVQLVGFLPQRDALKMMDETDYVLIINHDPLNVGGKFYDYIGSGKPIIGAVHREGETRRLLEDLRAGWWADINDESGLRQLFVDAVGRLESLHTMFQPDQERIALYERKALARRYAELLKSIAPTTASGKLQTSASQSER
jgi:glycosyltransferase involved in cell wall biosynthesis